MRKHKRIKLSGRILGWVSVGWLGLLLVAMLLPVTNKAQAEGITNAEQRVGLKAASTISLSVDSDSVNINILPTQAGQFQANSTKVGVVTNSEAGYRVLMSVLGDSNSLVSTDASKVGEQYQVKSITGEATSAEFANNTWGYALTKNAVDVNTKYKEIPGTSGAEIVSTTASTAGQRDLYNLAFGAKVSNSLPAGNYYNTMLISAVANAETLTSLDQVTYMQEVTPEICANTTAGTQRRLYDLRDGNKYWVEAMKDGHCWMIQNLALNLEVGHTFTSADTDLANTETGSWTVPEGMSTETEIPAPDPRLSGGGMRSWNLGKIILTNPTKSQDCPRQDKPDDSYPNGDAKNSAFHGQKITETCSAYYKDVDGWKDTFSATATISYDENTETGIKVYDPRYLIGNYYQFGVATAGTGTDLISPSSAGTNPDDLLSATGSICPKGWTLPKAGRNITVNNGQSFGINGSFYKLLSQYGYNGGWVANNNDAYIPISRGTNLAYSPLYFVRSGYINLGTGSLRFAGNYAYYASKTAFPDSTQAVYSLDFDSTNVSPSSQNNRTNGFSVRCVSAD